mmetsp:Transcript_14089/g.32831  ORF Transcript_14089/g.32831 Transcript_14089/m.32831 type:complete len:318 (-) Transcript_14089:1714-2667(-)
MRVSRTLGSRSQSPGEARRWVGSSDADCRPRDRASTVFRRLGLSELKVHQPPASGSRESIGVSNTSWALGFVMANSESKRNVSCLAKPSTTPRRSARSSALMAPPLTVNSAAAWTISRTADPHSTTVSRIAFTDPMSAIAASALPEKSTRSITRSPRRRKSTMMTTAQRTVLDAASRLATSRWRTRVVHCSVEPDWPPRRPVEELVWLDLPADPGSVGACGTEASSHTAVESRSSRCSARFRRSSARARLHMTSSRNCALARRSSGEEGNLLKSSVKDASALSQALKKLSRRVQMCILSRPVATSRQNSRRCRTASR